MKLEDIVKIITLGIPTLFFISYPISGIYKAVTDENITFSFGQAFNDLAPGIVYFIFAAFIIRNYEYLKLKKSDAKNKYDLEEENIKYKNEIVVLENRLKKLRTNYPRFEDIKMEKMKCGYIDYPPYLQVEIGGNLAGIGIEVLKSIFSVFDEYEIKYVQVGAWAEILRGLRSKKYNIVATPLYETRTRLYHDSNVSFCLPLFYAEIGLYAHNDTIKDRINLEEFSLKKDKWYFSYIKDEVSETMMDKLFDPDNDKNLNLEAYGQNDAGYIDLLKSVADRSTSTNIVAMEVFKAERLLADNTLELKNILKAKQILYPVSFAVRKEDTALRNFLNLRIIELLSGGDNNELLGIIQKEAERLGFDANSIFIHQYEWEHL